LKKQAKDLKDKQKVLKREVKKRVMLDDHQELKNFIKILPTAEELETLK
jgi:hypothetical protein